MLRFSANLSMLFGEVDFLDRFAAAAGAGFEAVEFLFPYGYDASRLVDRARSHDLQVVLFNMPPGRWEEGERGIACLPDRMGEFQDGVSKAIEYALALGCPRIHAMAGLRPKSVPDDRLLETYLANVRFAGTELAKHGLVLTLEAINTRDMPGYYLSTSRQAFELIEKAGLSNIYFQYDVYHMQIMEGDLVTTLEKRLPRIGHLQVADPPGRHEPGTGEVNFSFLFQHLERLGYHGWIGCEYRPLTTTQAGLGWLAPYLPERSTR
ncbi:MAG TPA: 2-oxo-tetronate isomerase [Anaeromyxobacteraceae bacterium]|nr:2-oxo-tetronate isomerase [Anaeromyxobacteraceae bacterium]